MSVKSHTLFIPVSAIVMVPVSLSHVGHDSETSHGSSDMSKFMHFSPAHAHKGTTTLFDASFDA
jgi:hypothetical protein